MSRSRSGPIPAALPKIGSSRSALSPSRRMSASICSARTAEKNTSHSRPRRLDGGSSWSSPFFAPCRMSTSTITWSHMLQVPPEVSVYEVSPRDGLQNEKATVPLGDKLRLIEALTAAGLRRIEATSFVSPKWIPQLADADDVARAVNLTPARIAGGRDVAYSALVPNARGLERAKAAGMTEIAVFLSASETHNQKNVNKS